MLESGSERCRQRLGSCITLLGALLVQNAGSALDQLLSQVKTVSNHMKAMVAVMAALYLLGLIPAVYDTLSVSVYK